MKSHEKISLELLHALYRDLCSMCDADVDQRDLDKLRSRVEHESDSFLTITLPKFGADFESALELGKIETAMYAGFSKNGKVPRLFGVFLSRVFDTTGGLLSDPDPIAVWSIRQLAYFHKKLKELCHDDKIDKAFTEYKEIERELADAQIRPDNLSDYRKVCHLIWDNMLSGIRVEETRPSHGPGATAEGISGNAKFDLQRWHDRLEGYFPLFSFGYPTESAYDSEYYEKCQSIMEDDEQPVKVIAVPKTAKTPRIIAEEPVCMQYCQHAISVTLVRVIENSDITRGHVNFTDQTVNQKLALQSSVHRHMATLDLKSASEWVINDLVHPLFESNPDLSGAIQACRSLRANVRGEIITLRKFASMGSALCFPIESMVFYTICVLALVRSAKLPLDRASVLKMARSIYVYGDDLIVPTHHASAVAQTLTEFLCKVNYSKSFSRGNFRESCGMDAFLGVPVTPVYLRKRIPSSRSDISAIVSTIATSNQLYKNGLWLTATMMKNIIERLIGKLPVIGETCAGLGWHSITYIPPHNDIPRPPKYREAGGVRVRWNNKLHRYECRTYTVVTKMKKSPIDSYPALTRFLLAPREELPMERDNACSPRRGVVTLKSRWLALD